MKIINICPKPIFALIINEKFRNTRRYFIKEHVVCIIQFYVIFIKWYKTAAWLLVTFFGPTQILQMIIDSKRNIALSIESEKNTSVRFITSEMSFSSQVLTYKHWVRHSWEFSRRSFIPTKECLNHDLNIVHWYVSRSACLIKLGLRIINREVSCMLASMNLWFPTNFNFPVFN